MCFSQFKMCFYPIYMCQRHAYRMCQRCVQNVSNTQLKKCLYPIYICVKDTLIECVKDTLIECVKCTIKNVSLPHLYMCQRHAYRMCLFHIYKWGKCTFIIAENTYLYMWKIHIYSLLSKVLVIHFLAGGNNDSHHENCCYSTTTASMQ